jgi:hypothetical protein
MADTPEDVGEKKAKLLNELVCAYHLPEYVCVDLKGHSEIEVEKFATRWIRQENTFKERMREADRIIRKQHFKDQNELCKSVGSQLKTVVEKDASNKKTNPAKKKKKKEPPKRQTLQISFLDSDGDNRYAHTNNGDGSAQTNNIGERKPEFQSAQTDASLLTSLEDLRLEEDLSPPTPSLADAKEGRRESEPSTNLQVAPDPEQHWKGFCLLAKAVTMQNTEGEHESNKKLYLKLSLEEQYQAAKGIETRNLPGMQFARGFVPTMRNYLLKKLWTAPLRGTPPPASEVQKATARQEFERLKKQRQASET